MSRRNWARNALVGAAAALWALSGSALAAAPELAPRPRPAPERPDRLRTRAPNVAILDLATGETLFQKEAQRAIPPASMTKLMTLYLAFEALESGELALGDRFTVSARAARIGGSRMWLKPGEQVRVEDLIRGVVVDSGNDAAIALAEGIGGDEARFARSMTARAAELGLESARFRNATGLPSPGHSISVADLARLATRLIEDFPDRYHYFSERRFRWSGVTQENRNPLLGRVDGVDGMKTGHTNEAGYCVVLSAERDRRRVVIVLAGLDTEDDRAREGRRAVNWAFDRF